MGRIPYGWEGRAPSGYLTGWLAVAFNLLLIALGVAMRLWPGMVRGIQGRH